MEEERSKLPIIIVSVLIVLVVLAILFVTLIYPTIVEKRKIKFKDDALKMYEGAIVLQDNLLTSDQTYNEKTVMCFSADYLKSAGALSGNYEGSVLAAYNKKENQVKYYVWLANKNFMLLEKTKDQIDVGNITMYDKNLSDNINHCPVNIINFGIDENADYLYCDKDTCNLDIKPTKKKYCKEGKDTGYGCLITTYVTCVNGYEMESNLDCVGKTSAEYKCQDGYYLDGNLCKMETDDSTCDAGEIVDGRCIISIPAKFGCETGTLVGSTCIDRYKLCEGTYTKESSKCEVVKDYAEGYACPDGYLYSNYRCVKTN